MNASEKKISFSTFLLFLVETTNKTSSNFMKKNYTSKYTIYRDKHFQEKVSNLLFLKRTANKKRLNI